MKMTLCVASLLAILSVSSVWAEGQPSAPVPAAPAPAASTPDAASTNGAIVDQGGNLHYQTQAPAANDQALVPLNMQPAQDQPQQPASTTPNTPGMSATQPTPPAH